MIGILDGDTLSPKSRNYITKSAGLERLPSQPFCRVLQLDNSLSCHKVKMLFWWNYP